MLRGMNAAETEVDGRVAGVEERLQLGRQRTLIVQDPGADLEHALVSWIWPGSQRRVGSQPGAVGEDVAAYVGHRREPDRCAIGVERQAKGGVNAEGIRGPELPVVRGRGRWRLP